VSADRPNRHLTVKEATTMVVVGADVHKRTHMFVAVDQHTVPSKRRLSNVIYWTIKRDQRRPLPQTA
jgi:hypothetical protein